MVLGWLPEPALQFVKKIYYLRRLESFSTEEEPDLKVVQYLVKPGDYVIDIGANIGIYSKFFSELVGPDGRVYSIEPVPSTYEILCSNISRLLLANVEPVNCAISDRNAVVTMEIPRFPRGGENYYRAYIIKESMRDTKVRSVDVEAVTIDSKFLDISGRISFIKCDVEGHELACLEGAKRFLAQCQPACLIEISDDPDNSESSGYQVFELLSERGYSPWVFDRMVLKRRIPGQINTNYFFLRDEHIDILETQEPNLFKSSPK